MDGQDKNQEILNTIDLTTFFSSFSNEQFINMQIIYEQPSLKITLLKNDSKIILLENILVDSKKINFFNSDNIRMSIKLLEKQTLSGNLLSDISWSDLYYN
jgi:hypothetical protein